MRWRRPVRTDTTCAGTPFAELKSVNGDFVERIGLWEDVTTTISQKWSQTMTANMWLWLNKHRRGLLDDFMAFSEPMAYSTGMAKRFSEFAEGRAAEQGVNVYSMLFGVPECAEQMLCVDDMAYSMTAVWFLRSMPEEMLLTLKDAPEIPVSKFAGRAFGPKRKDAETAYLSWRFSSMQKYALYLKGLSGFDPYMDRGEQNKGEHDVAMTAVLLGVPVEYALPLAVLGLSLSGIQMAWSEDMPMVYSLAVGGAGQLP